MDYEYKYLKYKKKYLELCKIKNNQKFKGGESNSKPNLTNSLESIEIDKLKKIIIFIFNKDPNLKEFVESIEKNKNLITELFNYNCIGNMAMCNIIKTELKKINSTFLDLLKSEDFLKSENLIGGFFSIISKKIENIVNKIKPVNNKDIISSISEIIDKKILLQQILYVINLISKNTQK